MAKHKYTTRICLVVIGLMLIGTVIFLAAGEKLGLRAEASQPEYATTLFATDVVHRIDIIVDEDAWQEMLDNAADKTYLLCDVVIDGELVSDVAIRPKGNSTLSTLLQSESDRYSFKIEFDHYNSVQTYNGLDKLALNNIAQDNTYMKDYISYQMMVAFGADAPLSSFAYLTLNGEDWGLYLAVEGIEEAFAERNYGRDYGNLYKPDNMDMAGFGGFDREDMQLPEDMQFPEGMQMPSEEELQNMLENGQFAFPGGAPPDSAGAGTSGDAESSEDDASSSNAALGRPENAGPAGQGNGGPGLGGGMGGNSQDIALQYIDDNFSSYANIFDNAIFDATDADKSRLIDSLQQLGSGENISEVVNIDEVLRYFVVHNFVLNFDSYTGSMRHNYYLYEEDGQISMIAWDYNLAFGAFGGMGGGQSGSSEATTMVNFPIDTPVSGVAMEELPLLYQLLTDEAYLAQYHDLFAEFVSSYFDSGMFAELYDQAIALISPYVEQDPTAFCSYEEFLLAQESLRDFCLLRAESVSKQLSGSISSTSEGQAESQQAGFVDASHIDMQVMGSNASAMGGGRGGNMQLPGAETATGEEGVNDATPPAEDESPPADDATQQPSDAAPQPPQAPGSPPSTEDGTAAPGASSVDGADDAWAEIQQQSRLDFTAAGSAAGTDTTLYVLLGTAVLLIAGIMFARRF